MKKDKKIIIALSVAIGVIFIAAAVTITILVVKDKKKDKDDSPSYVLSTTTESTTEPDDTDAWIDFDDLASDLATATDPNTTTTSSSAISIPSMPATSIVYVDPNGNNIDWEKEDAMTAKPTDAFNDVTQSAGGDNATFSEDYEINSKGVITGYIGKKTYVVIPKAIGNKKVTGIGNGCFRDSDIKMVYICDTVTYIGSEAFKDCHNLESVMFVNPASRVNIGNRAFQNCSKVKTIDFPIVESMGSSALENCTSLTSVSFADGSAAIGHFAFSGCTNLKNLNVPDTVKADKIGNDVFRGCPIEALVVTSPKNSDFETYCHDNKIRVVPPQK